MSLSLRQLLKIVVKPGGVEVSPQIHGSVSPGDGIRFSLPPNRSAVAGSAGVPPARRKGEHDGRRRDASAPRFMGRGKRADALKVALLANAGSQQAPRSQKKSLPFAIAKFRATGPRRRKIFGPLLAVFHLLAGISFSFAAKPQFAEFPGLFAPATNAIQTIAPVVPANPVLGTNLSLPNLTNGMESLDDKYRLAIGDRLSFRIVEDDEERKSLSVTDSGELELPCIGRYPAVGKTCKELARAVKAELEKEFYYHATVIVAVDSMTRSRGKVYLVGPVRNPGPQDIPSDEVFTLSKAILRAGGFGDYADRRKIKVTRATGVPGAREEIFTVNVEEVLEKGRIESDLSLQPGDLIYIPERLIRF